MKNVSWPEQQYDQNKSTKTKPWTSVMDPDIRQTPIELAYSAINCLW